MRKTLFVAAVAVAGISAAAQEREDRTLLSTAQMNAIINEASGERAMHHVLELVPYQFVRPPSEYQGHFRESEVMAKLAKEYGYANVAIEDYPTGQTWQPTLGELWMTTPRAEKIYDLHDIPESIAATNANADLTGELVSVGQGTAAEFEGKDAPSRRVRSARSASAPSAPAIAPSTIPIRSSRPRSAPRRARPRGRCRRRRRARSRRCSTAARR
jgi:hypothetical protein